MTLFFRYYELKKEFCQKFPRLKTVKNLMSVICETANFSKSLNELKTLIAIHSTNLVPMQLN